MHAVSVAAIVFSIYIHVVSHHRWQQIREMQANLDALDQARAKPCLQCNVIHFPKDGGCPKGWIVDRDLFTWRDGTKFPGCVNLDGVRHNGPRIDVLLGGETVSLPVMLMISQPSAPLT